MSFILEALKRADRERRQSEADGGPLLPTKAAAPLESRPRWPAMWWVGMGLALGLLAALAWRWGLGNPEPGAAGSLPTPAAIAKDGSSAAASGRLPTTPAVAPPAMSSLPLEPAASRPTPPLVPPLPVAPRQAAFLPLAPAVPPAPQTRAAALPPPIARAPAAPLAKTSPAESPAAPLLRDLPPDVRQRMPTFKLSGSIHSPNPVNRLLIVDGQVAHEGDTVAPEVVLERIQLRSAIFRFQQQRYEVPY